MGSWNLPAGPDHATPGVTRHMANQTDTTGHSPRERFRLPIIASGGPITRALAVMLDADSDRAEVRALRRAIAMRIEADIALLDRLGGDPDLEPSLGAPEPHTYQGQLAWAAGGSDDRENAACVDCDGETVRFVPLSIGRAA